MIVRKMDNSMKIITSFLFVLLPYLLFGLYSPKYFDYKIEAESGKILLEKKITKKYQASDGLNFISFSLLQANKLGNSNLFFNYKKFPEISLSSSGIGDKQASEILIGFLGLSIKNLKNEYQISETKNNKAEFFTDILRILGKTKQWTFIGNGKQSTISLNNIKVIIVPALKSKNPKFIDYLKKKKVSIDNLPSLVFLLSTSQNLKQLSEYGITKYAIKDLNSITVQSSKFNCKKEMAEFSDKKIFDADDFQASFVADKPTFDIQSKNQFSKVDIREIKEGYLQIDEEKAYSISIPSDQLYESVLKENIKGISWKQQLNFERRFVRYKFEFSSKHKTSKPIGIKFEEYKLYNGKKYIFFEKPNLNKVSLLTEKLRDYPFDTTKFWTLNDLSFEQNSFNVFLETVPIESVFLLLHYDNATRKNKQLLNSIYDKMKADHNFYFYSSNGRKNSSEINPSKISFPYIAYFDNPFFFDKLKEFDKLITLKKGKYKDHPHIIQIFASKNFLKYWCSYQENNEDFLIKMIVAISNINSQIIFYYQLEDDEEYNENLKSFLEKEADNFAKENIYFLPTSKMFTNK